MNDRQEFNDMPKYDHTQKAPLCLLIYAASALFLVVAWLLRNETVAAIGMLCGGVLMTLLATGFHHLRVSDNGDRLRVAFGPITLFRRSVPYSDIERVDIGRTTLVEGWGIHLSSRGGWVWNIWGRDCVVLHLKQGPLRIGTDDADRLSQFLRERMRDHAPQGA